MKTIIGTTGFPFTKRHSQNSHLVERIELTPDRQTNVRLDVVAADLGQRHINLMTSTLSSCTCSLKVNATKNLQICFKRCGMPKKNIHKAMLPVEILVGMLRL
jgi:hypothetical protein